jgi:hypothetical protein
MILDDAFDLAGGLHHVLLFDCFAIVSVFVRQVVGSISDWFVESGS